MFLGQVLGLPQGLLEELVSLLAVLMLVWVLKRLRESGSGRGLPSLYRSVSLLNRDYGTLVEMLDAWYQDLNRSETVEQELEIEFAMVQSRVARLETSIINKRRVGEDDSAEDDVR